MHDELLLHSGVLHDMPEQVRDILLYASLVYDGEDDSSGSKVLVRLVWGC